MPDPMTHDKVVVEQCAPWGVHKLAHIYSPYCKVLPPHSREVLAVAEPYTAGRLRAAWWVLTGRAYAFIWPKPGELEHVINEPAVECVAEESAQS